MTSNRKYIKYSVTIAIGLLISYAVAQTRGLFDCTDPKTIAMYVSDAFCVPGILLVCVGLLVWMSTTGFFDIFGYAIKSVFNRFLHPGMEDVNGTFYEYKLAQDEKRGKSMFFICFCGLGFLLVGVVAYIVYNAL